MKENMCMTVHNVYIETDILLYSSPVTCFFLQIEKVKDRIRTSI